GLEDPGTTGPDGPALSPAGRPREDREAAESRRGSFYLREKPTDGPAHRMLRRAGEPIDAEARLRTIAQTASASSVTPCGRWTPGAPWAPSSPRTRPCRPRRGS